MQGRKNSCEFLSNEYTSDIKISSSFIFHPKEEEESYKKKHMGSQSRVTPESRYGLPSGQTYTPTLPLKGSLPGAAQPQNPLKDSKGALPTLLRMSSRWSGHSIPLLPTVAGDRRVKYKSYIGAVPARLGP